jgi:hypothetical protein
VEAQRIKELSSSFSLESRSFKTIGKTPQHAEKSEHAEYFN